MKYLVYKITREDGKEYIGTTHSGRIKARMNSHRITDRFKGYNFEYIIMAESDNPDYILNLEEQLIEEFETHISRGGLNVAEGGKGANHNSKNFTTRGYRFSEESRKQMSRSAKERYVREGGFKKRSETIKRAWERGGKDLRERQSKARRGKIATKFLTDEEYADIRKRWQNYIPSDRVGKKAKNGRIFRAENEFAALICNEYGVSNITIKNIIEGKCLR